MTSPLVMKVSITREREREARPPVEWLVSAGVLAHPPTQVVLTQTARAARARRTDVRAPCCGTRHIT